jgi:hypothetical protein
MSSPQAKLAPGRTGAKVTSFDENAARAFVKRVMDEYPHAGRDEIVRRVRDRVTGKDGKYLPSFIDYATINAWRVIRNGEQEAQRSTPAQLPASSSASVSATATATAHVAAAPIKSAVQIEQERHTSEMQRIATHEAAKANVKVVLLDLLSPTGKLWRDLSVAEYMALGKKQFEHGRQLLAAGHKQTELLATATTEAEIQKVFK